jgi:hypothetical protein
MGTNTSKNIATVKAIGAGERRLGETADMLVSEDSDTYTDKKAASAEATRRVWEYVGGQDGAPAQKDRNKQPTDFGRGFGSLVSAVKNRLMSKTATDWLRLVEQAAKNATDKGGFSVEDILAAAKRGTITDETE